MNLHTNKEAFNNAILVTSDNTNIAPDFIEKDYWISLVFKINDFYKIRHKGKS